MASCQLRYVVPSTQCLITRHIVNAVSAAMTTALASACSSSCISRPRIGARVISTADIDNDEFSCCTFACSHWSHLQLSMFLYSKPTSCAHFRYLMHKLPYWSLTVCCSLCLKMYHSNMPHLILMQEVCAQCVHLCMFCSSFPTFCCCYAGADVVSGVTQAGSNAKPSRVAQLHICFRQLASWPIF